MAELIRYNDDDCEFSLFVSFAGKDNLSSNGWVSSLKNAIFERMNDLESQIPRKGIFFSADDPLSGGALGKELPKVIERSFAMLLVVGKHYVESGWCEQELKIFQEMFPGGAETRLYIAVMSQNQLVRAKQSETWTDVVPSDLIYRPMFQKNKPNEPLEHVKVGDHYPGEFWSGARGITDKLIEEITADWNRSKIQQREADKRSLELQKQTQVAVVVRPRTKVLLGPFTKTFEDSGAWQPITQLQHSLQNAGADVQILSRDVLAAYDITDGSPIRSSLAEAEVVVVPVLNEKPMMPGMPGGHAAIIAREWAALGREPRRLIWYRPDSADVPKILAPAAEHLAWFEQLAPVCVSPQAVVNLLFGAGTAEVIRVYIEDSPVIPIWGLSEVLEAVWKQLQGTGAQRPRLKCVPLRLSRMTEAPKDVAAVVLLDSLGDTPRASLKDRQSEIEKLFPKNNAAYPGLVALVITPPPPDVRMPDHEWEDVTFYRQQDQRSLKLEEQSQTCLRAFLDEVWHQYSH